MSENEPLIDALIVALRCLPGVGPKTAQRMAYHLLVRNQSAGQHLASAIVNAIENIKHCAVCRNLTALNVCSLCTSAQRDDSLLCIVESPSDVNLVDKATGFRGKYFVLMGRLSPLDGIGPDELGLHDLAKRFDSGNIREVVIATNPTVEGEATSHYISEMARKRNIKATRLAHGVPMGGELEYIDSNTLSKAFNDRRELV